MEFVRNLTGARIRRAKMSLILRQRIEKLLLSTTYFFVRISDKGWFVFADSQPLLESEINVESEKLKQFLSKNGIAFEFFDSISGCIISE